MVALFVVATIIVFFIIDYFVQRAEKRKKAVAPAADIASRARFIIPKEYFFGKGHVWIELLSGGYARIGLDDFVQKIVGRIDDVGFIPLDGKIAKGDKLFTIQQGAKNLSFQTPISGKIVSFNDELTHSPDVLRKKPYADGWVAIIEPSNLDEIKSLSKGTDAAQWLKEEIKRFRNFITTQSAPAASMSTPSLAGVTLMDGGTPVEGVMEHSSRETWQNFENNFLKNSDAK
ncbi:MAG: glycine cleavage system protein H [Candidatus Kryptoniota bacterium]